MTIQLDSARIVRMLKVMHRIRCFDEAAGKEWEAGKIQGPVHPSIGQEAIAAGVCAHLRKTDYLSTNHRCHAHAIAKGADPIRMMKELFGRAGGICGGKGGSMHLADFSAGMIGANGIVADAVPIAVGAAQAAKLLDEDRIVAVFFGDGAVNRGPLLEALNWAQAFALPVLFVCEDNVLASSTRTTKVTAGDIVARARGFGIPAEAVEGYDLLEVDALAGRFVSMIRSEGTPALMHARTYSWHGHIVGGSFGRSAEEEAEGARHMEADPIARCAQILREAGVEDGVLESLRREAESEVAEAVSAAHAAPWPNLGEVFTDVQDSGAPR